MASTLSRVTDFVPATPILSAEVDSEFNQLVNLLNGASTNIKVTLDVSDSGDPPLELNQLSTGPILKGFQAGVENFRIRNNGGVRTPGIYDANDNEQLLFSLTASAINEFTMKNAAAGNPPQLQATGGDTNIGITLVPKGSGVVKIQAGLPVANEDAANKLYVDNTRISFAVTLLTDADPNTAPGFTESGRFSSFVPVDGNAVTIRRLWVKFQEGSHTAGGVVGYNIRIRNAAGALITDLGPVQLKDGQSTIHVPTVLDVADTVLPAGGTVTIYRDATFSGTVSERSISAGYEGDQKRI
jgi:hypothetical protein